MVSLKGNHIRNIHLVIVFTWISLFFVSTTMFPSRVGFHFSFIWGIIFVNTIWGGFMYSNLGYFRPVCPVTTAEKKLIKQGNVDYDSFFVAEFFEKHLKFPRRLTHTLVIFTILLVTAQYFGFTNFLT